ncbi:MAG TPA: hypothetical protein PLM20_04320 [Syntrophomonadaceae bacterium]|nr:hypothetical protein [Syntrophomonadaceae bacterium]HQA07651.1 hypothetical protein [Syntrophomonadaceae bacterium]HQE23107.1 hypothetical protein [Syntrophomonadaceae bacterium]
MLLALALITFVLVVCIELPGLLKNRLYKEIQVFGILFLLGMYLTLAQLYQWPIPNPLQDLYPRLEIQGE